MSAQVQHSHTDADISTEMQPFYCNATIITSYERNPSWYGGSKSALFIRDHPWKVNRHVKELDLALRYSVFRGLWLQKILSLSFWIINFNYALKCLFGSRRPWERPKSGGKTALIYLGTWSVRWGRCLPRPPTPPHLCAWWHVPAQKMDIFSGAYVHR